MSRRKNFSKRILVVSATITTVLLVIVFGISYYALQKLAYAGDVSVYGKKLSELAQEIRTELLKRPDLKQVSFKSDGDIELAGFFIKRPLAKANLLLCHGYKSAKELLYAYIDLFPDWNILMFDFRAHGQSGGTITSIGYHEYKDVIAAAHFLQEETKTAATKPLPFIILGVSMGAAATIKAAEQTPGLCDAIIADSTFAHLDTTVSRAFSAKSNLPRYPFFPIIKYMFHFVAHCDVHNMQPAQSVKNIDLPILFIHSCDDSYIPPKNSIELYANAKNKNSKLWIGPCCRHAWLHSYHGDLYKRKVTKFLKNTLTTLC